MPIEANDELGSSGSPGGSAGFSRNSLILLSAAASITPNSVAWARGTRGRVAGVAAVGRIQRAARRALPRITAPVTVYRSARDAVVPASSHRTLVRGLRQAPVEVVGLPRSRHVATLDHDLPLLIDHGRSAVAAMTTH